MKLLKKIVAITCLLLILSSSMLVFADIGPKDELIINVVNPPAERYYLDILTTDQSYESNLSQDDYADLDLNMLDVLQNYKEGKWHAAYAGGTNIPMWGNIEGVKANDEFIHTFGYLGLPDTCRIIIVTESGKVVVSEEFTRQSLHSSIKYDFTNNEVVQTPVLLGYIAQFALTCLATLIIEILILIAFKFDVKKNIKIVLAVNVVTQIILTVIMGTVLMKNGSLAAYIIQVPAEIAVICIEIYIFGKKMTGHTAKRRRIYALVANLVSWGVGILMVAPIFQLFDKIL